MSGLDCAPTLFGDPLPNVPTMICTRLQLELLLQESFVDLSAVSEVILSDAGATLQILRLIGEEYADAEDRPTRMEDCIASLNIERCYDAICASSIQRDGKILAHWEHLRRVAHCTKELAKNRDGFSPEEAYLVGLLHAVGRFPHLLGWQPSAESKGEQMAIGVMLADFWHLPHYLLTAIREQQETLYSARWGELLQMATRVVEEAEGLEN